MVPVTPLPLQVSVAAAPPQQPRQAAKAHPTGAQPAAAGHPHSPSGHVETAVAQQCHPNSGQSRQRTPAGKQLADSPYQAVHAAFVSQRSSSQSTETGSPALHLPHDRSPTQPAAASPAQRPRGMPQAQRIIAAKPLSQGAQPSFSGGGMQVLEQLTYTDSQAVPADLSIGMNRAQSKDPGNHRYTSARLLQVAAQQGASSPSSKPAVRVSATSQPSSRGRRGRGRASSRGRPGKRQKLAAGARPPAKAAGIHDLPLPPTDFLYTNDEPDSLSFLDGPAITEPVRD